MYRNYSFELERNNSIETEINISVVPFIFYANIEVIVELTI